MAPPSDSVPDEPEPTGRSQSRARSYRRLARLAARALSLPMAALSFGSDPQAADDGAIRASFGFDEPGPDVDAFAARAAASSSVLVVPDAAKDDRFSSDALVTGSPHVRFCAGVPLVAEDGRTVGSLCVFGVEPRPDLSDDDVETLRDLASIAIAEIEHNGRRRALLVAQDEARRLATTDPLTGLSNRRMLDGLLDNAIALARRTGHALAVLMIGLDAPVAGAPAATRGERASHRAAAPLDDDLLVEMADRLARAVREHDLVARVGAGEFVVVLQAVDRAAVAEAAGRLHEALVGVIRKDAGSAAPADGRIRVSVGVALYPADGEDLASLLRAADLAMYEAQAGGGGVRRYVER